MYDCIIIGSGPAGMTASMYMCRAGYKIALITGSEFFGSLGKISLIENYPGIDQISGYNLATKMYEQLDKYHNLTKFEFLNVKNYYPLTRSTIPQSKNSTEHYNFLNGPVPWEGVCV